MKEKISFEIPNYLAPNQSIKWYDVVITREGKKYAINKDGKVLRYDYIGIPFRGKIRIVNNGKWGIINTDLETLIRPKYDFISMYDIKGYARVVKDKKWGLIDLEGEQMCDTLFDYISEMGSYAYGLIKKTYYKIYPNGKIKKNKRKKNGKGKKM